MPLFQRTIKLTLATCLAAALAYALGLTYAISAGVIAILSILDTRRSTIKQAYQRFMSTLLALAIGSLAFSFFGFNLWALGVFIALYVPCAFLLAAAAAGRLPPAPGSDSAPAGCPARR